MKLKVIYPNGETTLREVIVGHVTDSTSELGIWENNLGEKHRRIDVCLTIEDGLLTVSIGDTYKECEVSLIF